MQHYLIDYIVRSEFNFQIKKTATAIKLNKENKYVLIIYNYNYAQNTAFGDMYYGIVAKDYIN